LIIVEADLYNVSSVAAINYALSIDATVKVVKPIGRDEEREVLSYIEKWQDGENAALEAVIDKIRSRIGGVDLSYFEYVTFFTGGLPYSLLTDNAVPCSYVHLLNRTEQFLINNILFERLNSFYSAIVFSLDNEFHINGEGKWAVDLLRTHNYLVRELVGRSATVRNFDYNSQHFPYGILHIASHGGEIDGYAVTQEFTDRDGIIHVVEYDEVVSLAPEPSSDLIAVFRKTIFRTFDGFRWRSPELINQALPNHVFEDMNNALSSMKNWDKHSKRVAKDKISAACAIECSDSFHQGMFRVLASHSSPVIFNNTCSSWADVASFFLSAGARGYIGTLWDVSDSAAVAAAKAFYKKAFGSTLMRAVHKANKRIAHTQDRNIYVFWGLHFSTLRPGVSYERGAESVFRELVGSLFRWIGQIRDSKSAEVRKNAIEVVGRLRDDIRTSYDVANIESLEAEIRVKLGEAIAESKAYEVEREFDDGSLSND